MNDPLSPNDSQPDSYQQPYAIEPVAQTSSGLKLKLPALKPTKPIKGTKKSKHKSRFSSPSFSAQDVVGDIKRAPRPLKLKPLKEVLTKLIVQIKKKDDYAFFLTPVDVSKVSGYSDIIKRRMDFGTMSTKVSKGKYRSLEEFASDFKLVTTNAKLFNPVGTIYHTEADRIEVWGLDHISKAASTVIEYETDWNIEIENDDDDPNVNVDEDDENAGTPMDVREDGRSPSVSSMQLQPRRAVRAPYNSKKAAATGHNPNPNGISESIDADGRLPGSKEGLGAFPPGSDWAQMMLTLKLKGKRYRTKKERLRIEKGGPPYCTDGSLDYTEMEDPFSVLSILVPEPPARPRLTPLMPPSACNDPSQSAKTSVALPFPYTKPAPKLSTATGTIPHKRRHWTITRNAPTRGKAKEKEDDEADEAVPPRDVRPVDWGVFAGLEGMYSQRVHAHGVGSAEGELEKRIMEEVRQSVADSSRAGEAGDCENGYGYWTKGRAREAEEYVWDLVYGGVDGLAYVRSLGEFVSDGDTAYHASTSNYGLGMPLAKWVEQNLVDRLTQGRHALLRETAATLAHTCVSHPATDPTSQEFKPDPAPLPTPSAIAHQIRPSLTTYPLVATTLSALRQILAQKIDMGALIRGPEELFTSEEAWVGKEWKRRRIEELSLHESEKSVQDGMTYEGPDMLLHVLDHTAGVILEHEKKRRDGAADIAKELQDQYKLEPELPSSRPSSDESPALLDLRLNLLALAKRAPLDTLAGIPMDLVPAHIRCYVPTLS